MHGEEQRRAGIRQQLQQPIILLLSQVRVGETTICTGPSFVVWIIIVLMICGCGPTLNVNQNTTQVTEKDNSLEGEWGIQITGIRLSAAEYMLDFRYRIIDPNKAEPLLSQQYKPYLIDQKSGARLIVPAPPKVGSLRQKSRQPQAGKIYFIIFSNPGRLVKKGDKVTVIIGDFKAEDVIVK